MSGYITPRPDWKSLQGKVDPNGGFLCFSTHWRPDPEADDPDMPGQKMQMSSYISRLPEELCLCGSGKRYGDCCQLERMWRPICPNPGDPDLTYSLLQPQTARLEEVDGEAIRWRLAADPRLYCTFDEPQSSFWILFGHPALEDRYGVLCFGDIELKQGRTLIVTAMSDLRMQALMAVLQKAIGDWIGEPQITYSDVPLIGKPMVGMRQVRRASRSQPSRRRRKRSGGVEGTT